MMFSVNAAKEHMKEVEIFEIPGLFTARRIDRASVPRGMYAYDLQASEEDWTRPCRIASQVTQGHFGTVLTASPIDLPESGYREISPDDFTQRAKPGCMTVAEFEAQYLPPLPEAQRKRFFSGVSAR